ncbi:unnamed protein product, partial [Meganyctiphanes norvegica]
MRMVTLKKTEDGELNNSKPIILKKINSSLGESKDVIVNDLVPVSLLREPVVVVPSENRRSGVVFCKKRVRFSITKMDTDTNFKVTLSIKKEADGCPVFYK